MDPLRILALKNMKKHRRHYLISSGVIILTSAVVVFMLIVYQSQYHMRVETARETYGSWYFMGEYDLSEMEMVTQDDLDKTLANRGITYGYYDVQDALGQYDVGHLDEQAYAMAHIIVAEGHMPEADDEIAITKTVANENQLAINDTLMLGDQKMTVCGITEDTQEDFPDILTHLTTYTYRRIIADQEMKVNADAYGIEVLHHYIEESNKGTIDTTMSETIYFRNCILNPRGFSANENIALFHYNMSLLLKVIELTIFMMMALYAIELAIIQTRTHELTLLRAIGTTTRQLKKMMLLEALMTGVPAILLGTFAGVILSYSYIYRLPQSQYVCQPFLLGFVVLFMLVCLKEAVSWPITSSAGNSLVNTFDRKFHYFQISRKKLKRLSLRRLSWLGLMSQKRFMFVLIIVFLAVTFYTDHAFFKTTAITKESLEQVQFYHLQYISKQQAQELSDAMKGIAYSTCFLNQHVTYQGDTYQLFGSLACLEDLQETPRLITGHLPQASDELLVNQQESVLTTSMGDVIDLDVGAKLHINEHTYTVVGLCDYGHRYTSADKKSTIRITYGADGDLLCTRNCPLYQADSYCVDFYYQEENKQNAYLQLRAAGLSYGQIIDEREALLDELNISFDEEDGNPVFLLEIIFFLTLFLTIIHYLNVCNQARDYQILRIIGMDQTMLLKMALWHMVHVSLLLLMIEAGYYMMSAQQAAVAVPYLRLAGYTAVNIFVLVIIFVVPILLAGYQELFSYEGEVF